MAAYLQLPPEETLPAWAIEAAAKKATPKAPRELAAAIQPGTIWALLAKLMIAGRHKRVIKLAERHGFEDVAQLARDKLARERSRRGAP